MTEYRITSKAIILNHRTKDIKTLAVMAGAEPGDIVREIVTTGAFENDSCIVTLAKEPENA